MRQVGGFKLSSLEHLSALKAYDGKTTLVQLMVQQVCVAGGSLLAQLPLQDPNHLIRKKPPTPNPQPTHPNHASRPFRSARNARVRFSTTSPAAPRLRSYASLICWSHRPLGWRAWSRRSGETVQRLIRIEFGFGRSDMRCVRVVSPRLVSSFSSFSLSASSRLPVAFFNLKFVCRES